MKAPKVWHVTAFASAVLLTGAAVGVLATMLISNPPAPASLAKAEQPEWIGVTTQPSDDPKEIDVVVQQGDPLPLRVPVAGLVTETRCAAGEIWKSGEAAVSVDGTRLALLHTTVPLWRDLTPGTTGADTVAVKAELTRLGLSPSAGDAFSSRDLGIVRSLFAPSGVFIGNGSLSLAQVMWLPSPEVSPNDCVAVGTPLEAGDQLAETSAVVTIQLGTIPALQPGLRELSVDQVVIPLAEELAPLDIAGLTALLDAPSYRSALGEGSGPVTITAKLSLVEPVRVAPLPPSAVTLKAGSDACVETPSGQAPVSVVTSELGRTLVSFEDQELPELVRIDGPETCE